MSAFHNAFEAFLAAPGEGENGTAPETPSTSNSPGSEQTDPQSPNTVKKTAVGIVVKAPSPEAEILATPIRKSTRQRRRKRFESESSTSGQTDSVSIPFYILVDLFQIFLLDMGACYSLD